MRRLDLFPLMLVFVVVASCLAACSSSYDSGEALVVITPEGEDGRLAVTAVSETNIDQTIFPMEIPSITFEVTLDAVKTPISGQAFYVALDGDDFNDGSIFAPFKTFSKGVSVLKPGDALYIRGGFYTEPLVVDGSGEAGKPIAILGFEDEEVVIDMQGREISGVTLHGDYISFGGIFIRGSDRACVFADGNFQSIWNLEITDCFSSGIQLKGGYIEFFGNRVFGTVLRNLNGEGEHWNSAVKVLVGGHDLVISNNLIYGNWGEGIAVTRGARVSVQGNIVYDNWASNIYIDNSYDIVVERNFSYCTPNAPIAEDGYPANAYALGEEEYEGWGAQLAHVLVMNNIGAFCKRGIGSWSPEVPGGGLDTIKIVNNTFWGNLFHGIGIYVSDPPLKAQNTLIANNIFQQPDNRQGYIEDDTGITLENNFWVGEPPGDHLRLSGKNDLWGDVIMMSEPGYTAVSYRLSINSPAIGRGVKLDFVLSDFFGVLRDAVPDLGAIEFIQ